MDFDDALREVNREDATPVTALEDMAEQCQIAASLGFNLSSMSRTVGRPEDKTPASWLLLAAPLIEGWMRTDENPPCGSAPAIRTRLLALAPPPTAATASPRSPATTALKCGSPWRSSTGDPSSRSRGAMLGHAL